MHRTFAAALAVSALALTGAAPRPLELADLQGLVSYSGVAIAPDGRQVAAIARRADVEQNRYVTHLVLVDARTHALRDLTPDRTSVAGPAWSPSGDRIAFVSPGGEKKTPQLWVLPLDGGEAHIVTDAERGVDAFAWRPDGREIAFVTADESPDKQKIEAHDDGFAVTDGPWTARAASTNAHLWVVPASGGRARRVTAGAFSVVADAPLSYRAGGAAIAFTRALDASLDGAMSGATVALADVRTGAVRAFGPPRASSALYDRAGRALAYEQPNPLAPVQNDIVFANGDGTHPIVLGARFDRNPGEIAFLPDGALVATAPDGTAARAFVLHRDGAPVALPLGEVNPSGISVANNGTLAIAGATANDPSELYVLHRGASAPERLTGTNGWLAHRPLGTKRTLAWRSADGVALDAVVTEPPGFRRGQRYPLVLLIHGGPTAASRATFGTTSALLAARGWLVLEPNYRGSDNHGARSIATSLGRPTSVAGDDILRAVDALEREGVVDTTRIGISGWSAGGMMTSWLIAHDTRWRAAFDGAAVDSLPGVVAMSDASHYGAAIAGGDPWRDAASMQRALAESPITYADRVRTPTLVVTDAGDQRVPTPLSYAFYHAVRATGTPVQLLIYPVNGHGPGDPLHAEDVTRRWVGWFAEHFR